MKVTSPKVRQKRVASFAAAALFFVFGIYKFLNGAYMYAAGSAGLAVIYFWLGLKKTKTLDDNLKQSLSELADTLPDINDNQ